VHLFSPPSNPSYSQQAEIAAEIAIAISGPPSIHPAPQMPIHYQLALLSTSLHYISRSSIGASNHQAAVDTQARAIYVYSASLCMSRRIPGPMSLPRSPSSQGAASMCMSRRIPGPMSLPRSPSSQGAASVVEEVNQNSRKNSRNNTIHAPLM
jgi:hypothetical protein